MTTTLHSKLRKLCFTPLFVLFLSLGIPLGLSQPVELVENGSFESGDLSGWMVAYDGFAFGPWIVSAAGTGSGNNLAPTTPQDGDWVAWNGFDGFGGPMLFMMYQDVAIPLDHQVTLSWMDRIQWYYTLAPSSSRQTTVELRDPTTGELIETLDAFDTGLAPGFGDTEWQLHVIDLSKYAGSTIRLLFLQVVNEPFTGPAQVELDAVSIVAEEIVSDSDGDGIPDTEDACPESDLSPTLVIRGRDTGVENILISDGCTLADMLHECELATRNHGAYIRCTANLMNELKAAGVISGREKGKVLSCAARTMLRTPKRPQWIRSQRNRGHRFSR